MGPPWKTWPCQGPKKWDNLQGLGLENTGGISGDLVTHMGALKGSAVSRKLEGAGILWGYMATHRDSEGCGGFMQKLGSHIPLETKTETSPRVSVSPWSE